MSVILLDGAVGTSLWEKSKNRLPVWRYNLENPKIVLELHGEYLAAGAQIILANTFGANRAAVKKGTDYSVNDVAREGVRLAKHAARGSGAKVALSVGPLLELLKPHGKLSEEDAAELFSEQIAAGAAELPDLIWLQTFMDLEMMKIAVQCARKHGIPIFCSMSFEMSGKTMMKDSVAQIVRTLEPQGIDAVGLNCSVGPEAALPVLREFHEHTNLPLLFKPNAGLTTISIGIVQPGMDIEHFVRSVLPAADAGATYIGGCCGTNAAYIRALRQRLLQTGQL